MRLDAIRSLNVDRVARWLMKAGGSRFEYAICDDAGRAIWSSSASLPETASICAPLQAVAPVLGADAEGTRCIERDNAAHLYYHRVSASAGKTLGYLVAAPASNDPVPCALETERLDEAMTDAAGALRDEYRLTFELDSVSRELAERYEELHLVYGIDRQLVSSPLGDTMLVDLLRVCAEQLRSDVAALVVPSRQLTLHATNLSKPIDNLDLVLVEMRGDLLRFVSASRSSAVLNDLDDPRRAYLFTDMAYRVLACPVLEGVNLPGMLVLLRHIDRPEFTNSDLRLGEVVAHQLSTLSHVQELLHTMQLFNEQMAAALIEAVEAKDPYTRGHSERVHWLSVEIGRAMSLPQSELDDLYWSALLHDVGKIGIPDAVLCKPTRLSKDEYAFVMVHPERSYEILRHIERLKNALPGVRHHQERYDGTGYPQRLKGKNIPLHARIIAVADTYDAMTSSRAYRPGRTHEEAQREIARVSGTQLDPDIVAVFGQICAGEPAWLRRFNIRREHVGS